MDTGLRNTFRSAEYNIRQLESRTDYLRDEYRQCAGGEILKEYQRSMDLAMDRIKYVKSRLLQLEEDMDLYEQM